VYEPEPAMTLSPGMAGTVKVCVPDDVLPEEEEEEELVACGVAVACLVGRAEVLALAVAVGSVTECRCVREADGDGAGVLVNAVVGAAAAVSV
jgi:hypothetical protein